MTRSMFAAAAPLYANPEMQATNRELAALVASTGKSFGFTFQLSDGSDYTVFFPAPEEANPK